MLFSSLLNTDFPGKSKVKAAKFVEPIVFAKRVVGANGNSYQIAMFLFQSTGPTNIMTVNSIVSGKAYIRTKIRGHGEKHYVRVLEDNQARTTYLGMYGIIGTIDAAINRYCLDDDIQA